VLKLIKLEADPSPFQVENANENDNENRRAGSWPEAMDEKWKIGAGTQIGAPICITRSNRCLHW
jgi:hypothetical protein